MTTYNLSSNQIGFLQGNYPGVAAQTEGGGMYFSPPMFPQTIMVVVHGNI